ncbi:LuxR C-terminal-related transcriptional regulator [Kitasatospora sp. NPDC004240]
MRIVIADDTPLIRDGLDMLLRAAGVEVVAVVSDGEQLLRAVAEHRPQAALVDIRMPPTYTDEGITAARRIVAEHPGVGVLLLSLHLDPDFALELLTTGHGRIGYLLKERLLDTAQLVDALERVAAGWAVLDPAITDQLVNRQKRSGPVDSLTERERQVLALMAEGLTNPAIGERLQLSPKTVETHVANILGRLGIPATGTGHRRVQAVLAYLDHRRGLRDR